jgi:tRNA-splicing ligase RtcB
VGFRQRGESLEDAGVLDEIPGAYKPIGEVIEKSADPVEVVARLKQSVCVKGLGASTRQSPDCGGDFRSPAIPNSALPGYTGWQAR